jgi:hypothetical protein
MLEPSSYTIFFGNVGEISFVYEASSIWREFVS